MERFIITVILLAFVAFVVVMDRHVKNRRHRPKIRKAWTSEIT